MAFLGIDYGLKRIGLALSDGMIASPLPTLIVKNRQTSLEQLVFLIDSHNITKVVFGLPDPDRIGAKKFAEDLGKLTKAEIVLMDETLTSQVALSHLKAGGKRRIQKGTIDAASATLLLQEVLDQENK